MSTSPLSPEEIRAAAEVHRELGPQYSDAVVQSFLDRIDGEITARIAALPQKREPRPDPSRRRRAFLAGTAVGVVGAGIPLTMLALSLTREADVSQGALTAIWIVIGVIFIAMVAGLTGLVTIQLPSAARKRRAQPGSISSPGQEGPQAT